MSKKAAFTMVELIFVIVILGILAAVAVPKLNASREDAKIAAVVADIRTIWDDIQSYYLAQGEIEKDAKIAQMSNVPLSNTYPEIYWVDDKWCLSFYTKVKANCITILRAKAASSACRKAVKKAEFLRGRQYYGVGGGGECQDELKKSKITSLDKSNQSDDTQAITVFFGEDGVEW